jgi:hypothetical protein
MVPNIPIDEHAFRLFTRPDLGGFTFLQPADPHVRAHLDDLNKLLGKRVFGTRAEGSENATVAGILALPLTPKKVTGDQANGGHWAADSLLDRLSHTADDPDQLTLGEFIDVVPALAAIKYPYEQAVTGSGALLDYNVRIALNDYPAIRDYLLVFAVKQGFAAEINGLKNFVLNNAAGAKNIVKYSVVSAARTYIVGQQLNVADYNNDTAGIVTAIKNANLSVSVAAFIPALKKIITDFVFNGDEARLLAVAEAQIGAVPAKFRPQLIKMIKAARETITIDDDNVTYFVPLFLTQLIGTTPPDADDTSSVSESSEQDFTVAVLQGEDGMAQISRSAVKCSAQLFWSMVMGEELELFDVVNYLTHNYLLRGGIDIQDSTLRDDLQGYVFSNRFYDVRAKKVMDRTRPAERQMFYRQVFNAGGESSDAELNEVLVPNREFPKLWRVLMLETAKYIERAQTSPNPENYVSKQNIMQAVEDLQYNLSTNCIGMVNVVTPLIYAELDFVIRRIFMHEEVRRQLAPNSASWWRVVENLYTAMRNRRPKATVLYNKAKLGNDILVKVAEYDPGSFQDNEKFGAFVSDVEAFITTQSILQGGDDSESDTDSPEQEQEAARRPPRLNRSAFGPPPMAAAGAAPGKNGSNGSNGSGGEWDF